MTALQIAHIGRSYGFHQHQISHTNYIFRPRQSNFTQLPYGYFPIDILADVYSENSLKNSEREIRGISTQVLHKFPEISVTS